MLLPFATDRLFGGPGVHPARVRHGWSPRGGESGGARLPGGSRLHPSGHPWPYSCLPGVSGSLPCLRWVRSSPPGFRGVLLVLNLNLRWLVLVAGGAGRDPGSRQDDSDHIIVTATSSH